VSTAPAGAASQLAPYEAIVAHAELELELAGHGRVTELEGLTARWDELLASLPERPPADAAQVLARARLIHERTRIELLRLREALLSDLAGAAQAKRTADGYAVAGGQASAPALDRRA
jgi:hypothetical protein